MKMGDWIPCNKKLPEEDGQYLITVKYEPEEGHENIYTEHGEWFNGNWDKCFFYGYCGKVESILAWMPMPDPYREEGDKDA